MPKCMTDKLVSFENVYCMKEINLINTVALILQKHI